MSDFNLGQIMGAVTMLAGMLIGVGKPKVGFLLLGILVGGMWLLGVLS